MRFFSHVTSQSLECQCVNFFRGFFCKSNFFVVVCLNSRRRSFDGAETDFPWSGRWRSIIHVFSGTARICAQTVCLHDRIVWRFLLSCGVYCALAPYVFVGCRMVLTGTLTSGIVAAARRTHQHHRDTKRHNSGPWCKCK